MSDYYWVGGTGNISGAHLATSSGGAGGTVTLGSSDTLTFDSNSGTGTATIDVAVTVASCTINKAGLTVLCNAPLNATSTSGTGMTLKTGTLNTNGQSCTWSAYQGAPSGAGVRSLLLGASQITLTSTVQPWLLTSTTNYTFNAGTSKLIFSGNGPNLISLGSLPYYDLEISNLGSATVTIAGGGNTYHDLKVLGGNSKTGILQTQGFTWSGLLTLQGQSELNRILVQSSGMGSRRTYTSLTGATYDIDNVTFQDIAAAGPAAPFSGNSLGDADGNANISFSAPLPLYRVGAGGNWSDVSYWFTDATDETTGAPIPPRVPLAQDTVVVDGRASGTITADMPRLGSRVDFSGFAGTFAPSVGVTVYGTLTLSNDPAFSWTGTQSLILGGRHTQLLTTNGKTIPATLRLEAPGGTYQLQDDLTVAGLFNFVLGTFDANDHDVTLGSFSSTTGNNDRELLMGSGLWTLTGTGTVWSTTTNTALTIDPGTSTIVISDTSSAAKTFVGNGRTYHDLTFNGGTGTFTFGGSTFATMTWAPGSKIVATADTTTTVDALDATGTAASPITVSSTTPGTAFALRKFGGTVAADYLVLTDSSATGTAQWFAGRHSTDGGNNHGWQFGDPTAAGNAMWLFMTGREV